MQRFCIRTDGVCDATSLESFGGFLRLPAGFAAPLHRHTHPIRVVVIAGTYIQGPEGKPEFRIGPGSYFLQPGGNYWHTTSCDKDEDCVIFFESTGAFDLIMKDAKPPETK